MSSRAVPQPSEVQPAACFWALRIALMTIAAMMPMLKTAT